MLRAGAEQLVVMSGLPHDKELIGDALLTCFPVSLNTASYVNPCLL